MLPYLVYLRALMKWRGAPAAAVTAPAGLVPSMSSLPLVARAECVPSFHVPTTSPCASRGVGFITARVNEVGNPVIHLQIPILPPDIYFFF